MKIVGWLLVFFMVLVAVFCVICGGIALKEEDYLFVVLNVMLGALNLRNAVGVYRDIKGIP
jgi:hypothetical protein